jgi:hypothetical protein
MPHKGGIGCLLQPMAVQHVSNTTRSGQAMVESSVRGDNVPPHIP